MFTLRFMRPNGDSTVVTSPTYELRKTHAPSTPPAKPVITHAVITVPNPTDSKAPPMEYMVGEAPGSPGKGFHQCFVENSVGKTIDRIGPYTRNGGRP